MARGTMVYVYIYMCSIISCKAETTPMNISDIGQATLIRHQYILSPMARLQVGVL